MQAPSGACFTGGDLGWLLLQCAEVLAQAEYPQRSQVCGCAGVRVFVSVCLDARVYIYIIIYIYIYVCIYMCVCVCTGWAGGQVGGRPGAWVVCLFVRAF